MTTKKSIAMLVGGGHVIQRRGHVEVVGGKLHGRTYRSRREAIQAARAAHGRHPGQLNYGD